jgi:hypothetical protein
MFFPAMPFCPLAEAEDIYGFALVTDAICKKIHFGHIIAVEVYSLMRYLAHGFGNTEVTLSLLQ